MRERHGVKAPEPERQVTAMLYNGYNAWDECSEADDCELICSFLELVDAMVRDIQHLKAEAIRERYRFAMETGPERKQITTVDILSDLDMSYIMTAWHIRNFSGTVMMGETLWPSKSSQSPWYSLQRGATMAGIKLARFHYD